MSCTLEKLETAIKIKKITKKLEKNYCKELDLLTKAAQGKVIPLGEEFKKTKNAIMLKRRIFELKLQQLKNKKNGILTKRDKRG